MPRARKRQEGLFTRLLGLRREIDELLCCLLTCEAWLAYQGYLTSTETQALPSVPAGSREGGEAQYTQMYTFSVS
eukprot:3847553-Rhodomonas_salina.1